MKLEVPSHTDPDRAYEVDIDQDLGRVTCTCSGFEHGSGTLCSHARAAVDMNSELVAARAKVVPAVYHLKRMGLSDIANLLSEAHPNMEGADKIWKALDEIDHAVRSIKGLAVAWRRED